jgi:hypothetical protein
MADVPEYKRGNRIEPGAPVQGFEQAYSNLGAATRDIGAFGNQLAQNAANQIARQKGIDAAQTPGRKLIPAFTQADSEFTTAYKQEEANVLQFQGNQSLKKLYTEANKNPNPTSADLNLYEKNAKKSIDDLLQLSDTSNKTNLKRALENSYDGYFYDLANKVDNSNRRYMSDSLSAQSESTRELMSSAARDGRTGDAEALYQERLKQIDQKAALEGLSAERVAYLKNDEKEFYANGHGEYEYLKKTEQEKPEYIASIRKDPDSHEFLKGLNRAQQDRVIGRVQQFANQYESAFKGQQYINYANLLAKSNMGQLSQEDIESSINDGKITAHQLADLKLRQSNASSKSNRIHNEATGIVQNYDNPIFLANTTDAPRNYAADKIIIPLAEREKGGPLTLSEQSQLLTSFKAPVESLQKRISAGLTSGTPAQKIDAAQSVAIAKEANPLLVKGMSKNDLALAGLYNSYSKNPQAMTEEGMKSIEDKIFNISKEDLEERQLKTDTYFKDRGLNDAGHLRYETLRALGLNNKSKIALDPGLTIVYANKIRDAIMRTGDISQAEEDASFELKQYYGPDDQGEVMYMPPNKAYTDLGYILNNDQLRSVKEMVDKNTEYKNKNGFVMTELEWENPPDFSKMTSGPLHEGSLKLKVNGEMRPIVVKSDITTQLSPLNDLSWAIGFLDNNKIFNPLIDPYARFGTYRFWPNKEFLESSERDPDIKMRIADHEIEKNDKEMSEYEESQLNKARAIQGHIKDFERQVRENPYGY